jgi:hypothetical protein
VLARRFSREFQLLLACSWLPPPPEQLRTTKAIQRLSADGLDWNVFLALVRRHQVPGLAQLALARAGAGLLPPNVAGDLKGLAQSASRRALQSAAELVRLCTAFEAKSIAIVPLKGVILSWQLFGDPGTRYAGDLDVMIRPDDLGRADVLLCAIGYVCSVPTSGLRLLRTHSYECTYRHGSTGHSIDVHWGNELWTAGQTAELWDHCETREWGGAGIRHLNGDALLLFLCDHGTKHRWSLIKWLGDVAMLLAVPRAAPWGDLFALAARWDLEQPLAEAALLVHSLYGAELPPSMVRHDAASAAYASESITAMLMTREELALARKQSGAWQNLRFSMRRRKTLSWRAHLRRLLIQEDDLQRFPLPAALAWSYYPLRPLFWWCRRYGRPAQPPPVALTCVAAAYGSIATRLLFGRYRKYRSERSSASGESHYGV